jgi:hypothetical protein
MQTINLPKIHEITKSWVFWLLVVTGVAIIIRSAPAWINYAWGADFGIYYGLTVRMIENPQIFTPYDGWGDSYSYFPVLYIVSAFGHWLTGMDLIWIMGKIAPIFGGLTILIFYFIVYELTKNRTIALLSSFLLAIVPFHVYQTSHAAPLTMGHFFMMLSMYFYIRFSKNSKYLVPLMISTLLLIMSHHLTTYFYLIALLFILIIKSLNTEIKMMWKDITYITTFSAMTFSYWFFIATPVFSNFMERGTLFQAYQLIIIFFAALFMILVFVHLAKKYLPKYMSFFRNLFWSDAAYNHKRALVYFCISVVFILCAEVIFLFVNFPVSGIRMTPLAIFYSLPLVFFIGISSWSMEYLRGIKNYWFFKAWLLAMITSFTYTILTSNHTLFPDRHIEYIAAPLCFLASVGVIELFKGRSTKIESITFSKHSLHSPIKTISFIVIGSIIFSNAVAVYPVYDSLEWMDESIPETTVYALGWINENLDSNTTIFATDLRLSKLLWAEGYNSTYSYTYEMWICESWFQSISDLDSNKNHSRVTHILIDDSMYDTSVNIKLKISLYMTTKSYNKFLHPPFKLVYRNTTLNQNMEEIHWTEIYEVNWNYIEKILVLTKT